MNGAVPEIIALHRESAATAIDAAVFQLQAAVRFLDYGADQQAIEAYRRGVGFLKEHASGDMRAIQSSTEEVPHG